MLTRDEVNTLAKEAWNLLNAYLSTGIRGFRQQGIDRARAIGINTRGVEGEGDGGIRCLIACLEESWID